MTEQRIGIIMHGVTGRVGLAQHLLRSICALRDEGGVLLANGTRLIPDPILVGRNPDKLRDVAQQCGISRWTTDLDSALSDINDSVFFDAGSTLARQGIVKKAILAGKHVYCEKPVATILDDAMEIYRLAQSENVKHGVVQPNLWLPGLVKLRKLIDANFFGRILSVRGEFGYWVFEGDEKKAQRPSWNYRKEEGGGILLDIMSHWRYELDNLFGNIRAVSCIATTHIPTRWDEAENRYEATADDAAYVTMQLDGGVIAQINSSWCTRVRRDDLLTIHVDGTNGSAVAGASRCIAQSRSGTPSPVWNPEATVLPDYFSDWQDVPDTTQNQNPFKTQWALFLKHVAEDAPFPWNFREGAKGVQLTELCHRSWTERQWIDVPELANAPYGILKK